MAGNRGLEEARRRGRMYLARPFFGPVAIKEIYRDMKQAIFRAQPHALAALVWHLRGTAGHFAVEAPQGNAERAATSSPTVLPDAWAVNTRKYV